MAFSIVINKKIKLTDAQMAKLWRDRSRNMQQALALYSYLTPEQISGMIRVGDIWTITQLLRNKSQIFNAAQITKLAAINDMAIRRLVVNRADITLDAKTVQAFAQAGT